MTMEDMTMIMDNRTMDDRGCAYIPLIMETASILTVTTIPTLISKAEEITSYKMDRGTMGAVAGKVYRRLIDLIDTVEELTEDITDTDLYIPREDNTKPEKWRYDKIDATPMAQYIEGWQYIWDIDSYGDSAVYSYTWEGAVYHGDTVWECAVYHGDIVHIEREALLTDYDIGDLEEDAHGEDIVTCLALYQDAGEDPVTVPLSRFIRMDY